MTTAVPDALSQQRIEEFDAMTNTALLLKAADIVEKDPFLAKGAFVSLVGLTRKPPLFPDTDLDDSRPCHCLWGAVREAVGMYPNSEDTFLTDKAVEAYFGQSPRHDDIARLVAYHLDLSIAGEAVQRDVRIRRNCADWRGAIFAYSDITLHWLGMDGPAKAGQILRAAAKAA